MKTLVIAEKPSVAQDIVRAMTPTAGKFDKHDEHFENETYVVTSAVGQLTRLPSLELSCDEARRAGNCDSGYSCSYQFNLAWKSETTPLAPERDPKLAFERLFGSGGGGSEEDAARGIEAGDGQGGVGFRLGMRKTRKTFAFPS